MHPPLPVLGGGECVIAQVDLRGRADVADWLEDLRNELAQPPPDNSFHASLARGRE